MEQRVGLPITISAIYLEVGWRVGLPLSGVGLPGHFIVRCDSPRGAWFIDPYNRGDVLNESDCARLIHQATNGRLAFDRTQLRPVSRRSILARMLNNLKAIYIQNEQFKEVRVVMQRLLDLDPESAEDTRDMGLVQFRLGEYRKAISTLESYFVLQHDADDIDDIRQVISAARGEMARWN
jgi:regulator of sirC expression with transglutaminase-like and TPR domain